MGFTFGSTTSISGVVTFTLPVTANATVTAQMAGSLYMEDLSSTGYTGMFRIDTTTTASFIVQDSASTFVRVQGLNATIPFTWGTGDYCSGGFTYEAA